MAVKILIGDVREILPTLEAGSVQCCVTSPPYWGLRDYGVAGQLGLEDSPEEYLKIMVDVFREVRRVLRDDGTAWLNMGDCYAATTKGDGDHNPKQDSNAGSWHQNRRWVIPDGLKPKDLVGMPWRLAFALQADGWYLRSDIIWHKPNPMPESVTDRPTKSHEYVFLLSKSARYYYAADEIKESSIWGGKIVTLGEKSLSRGQATGANVKASGNALAESVTVQPFRNRRSVWTIPTEAFPGAHFATFPTALVEPCIKAGCPEGGTVLDPFGGAGTTGLVADRLNRSAILIELNPEYAEMARRRIVDDCPMFAKVETP